MNSRKLLIYLSLAALFLIIFAIVGKKAGWFGKSITYKVTTEYAKRRDLTEIITANGKIQPEIEVKITSDVSGEIVDLVVKDGDYVKKGQFLLKVKPDNYISARDRSLASLNAAKANMANAKAMLIQVQAKYEQARLSYNRSKKLWEERTISEAEWESAQSSYEVAKAEVTATEQSVAGAEFAVHSSEASLKEANENLVKTSVLAPMDGTISLLNVEKGERVVGTDLMSGTEILRVANLDRMEVLTEVNENDIVRVKLNDSAQIEVDAFPDRKFKGIVTEIANSAITTGVTTDQVTNFEVKILLIKDSYADLIKEGKPQPFRPGMSASVDIMTESKKQVITVPLQSVTMLADSLIKSDSLLTGKVKPEPKEVVFVYDKGKAKTTVVKTGIQDNNYIEIVNGLADSTEVVTAPYNVITKKLKDGSLLKKSKKKNSLNKYMAAILNIDTATPLCSVALAIDGRLIAQRETQEEKSHAARLTVYIEEILVEQGLKIKDLHAIAIGKGPGSYTGLRIGVSTAKGLCYGAGIPLIAVSTLRIMINYAKEIFRERSIPLDENTLLCPMIDARRMEVFSCLHNASGEEKEPISAKIIDSDTYTPYLQTSKIYFFGSGMDKCRQLLSHPNAYFLDEIYPHAAALAALSEEKYQEKQFENLAYFEPFYLKEFVATVPKKGLPVQ